MDWTPWLKLIHVAAGFLFALAHGVSAFAVLKMRAERDPVRVMAVLDLSRYALPMASLSIVILLISGIVSGFVGNYWGHLWIWISIAVLVALFAFMGLRGTRHLDAIRHALGLNGFYDKKATPAPAPDPAALPGLLDSPRANELAAVGFIGLGVLLWLMVVKPF